MPQGLTLEQATALGFKPKAGLTLAQATALGFKPSNAPQDNLDPDSRAIVDLGKGVLKGAGSTAFSLADLTNSGMRAVLPEAISPSPFPNKPDFLTPKNTPQKVGFGAEQMGEFALPAVGGLGKVSKAMTVAEDAPLLMKGISAVGKGSLEALSAGAVTKAQGGSGKDANTNAAIAGGLTTGGAALSELIKSGAAKTVMAALKPTLAEVKNGFKPENVFKYNVGGGIGEMAVKSAGAIKQRAAQLNELLQSQPVEVNLHKAIDAAEAELLGSTQARAKNATFVQEVQTALGKFRKDANAIAPRETEQVPSFFRKMTGFGEMETATTKPAGEVDLLSANAFKRAVGLETNFEYGERSREAKGLELVANVLYSKVRQQIETAAASAGPAIARTNGELGELIPIERAAIRRIPIDRRQNMISLGTLITGLPAIASGDVAKLGVPAGYALSKSPAIANLLQKAANVTAGGTGRVAAGANRLTQKSAP